MNYDKDEGRRWEILKTKLTWSPGVGCRCHLDVI